MADIEEKLDILIKAYMEDRQRFQTLPLTPQVSKHSNNNNHLPNIIENSQCDGITNTSSRKSNEWLNRSAKMMIDVTTSSAAMAMDQQASPSSSSQAQQGTIESEYTKVCCLYTLLSSSPKLTNQCCIYLFPDSLPNWVHILYRPMFGRLMFTSNAEVMVLYQK